ncbi:hypothetical protein EON65_43170, partial [archaeon]
MTGSEVPSLLNEPVSPLVSKKGVDLLAAFDEVDLVWQTPTSLASSCDVSNYVNNTSCHELISHTKAIYRTVAWDSSDRAHKAYMKILKIASLSIHVFLHSSYPAQALNPHYESIWDFWLMESDILDVIDTIFTCPTDLPASVRKLALDTGFSLLTNTLDFEDDAYGFSYPLSKTQAKLLSLLGMYLECFMVTS